VETQAGAKEMKVEILSEKENPLLKRKEFEVRIIHDAATPSISEARKKISTSKNIGKGTLIIDSFKSKYGSRETVSTVKVYQTKERALEIEPRHRLIKNGLIEVEEKKEPKSKEEAKPEEVKEKPEEEKPTEKKEEKTEEKPEEEPKKEPKKAKEESEPKEAKKKK
jgi:small subunit ribosomal protein S24e